MRYEWAFLKNCDKKRAMANTKRQHQPSIEFVSETALPTAGVVLNVRAYRSSNGTEPLAIYTELPPHGPVPLRIHDACFTSEVLGSIKCDCKAQLDFALEYIQQHGGLIIYLHQEGRGIGLANKIAAYALQEQGLDTVEANRALHLPDDARQYDDAANILKELGIQSVALLTNNPRKATALKDLGISVMKRLPIFCKVSDRAQTYLDTKILKMGHYPMPQDND